MAPVLSQGLFIFESRTSVGQFSCATFAEINSKYMCLISVLQNAMWSKIVNETCKESIKVCEITECFD